MITISYFATLLSETGAACLQRFNFAMNDPDSRSVSFLNQMLTGPQVKRDQLLVIFQLVSPEAETNRLQFNL